MTLHLPRPALAKLRRQVGLLDNQHVGQRSLGAEAGGKILAEHSLTWADVIDAAFGPPDATERALPAQWP